MNIFSSHWLLGDTDLSQFKQYDWFDGLLVFLIGVAIVILMLSVIIIVVKLYCAVINPGGGKKKEKKIEQPREKVEPVMESVVPTEVSNDDEIIAVITAAIATIYASQTESGEVPPFRVKSIIRK